MFTTNHFIWIAICLVIILGLLFLSIKFKWDFKKAVYVMSLISIASELLKIFTHINPVSGEDGDWSDGGVLGPGSLPFHLCSIFIFIFFYLALSNNQKTRKFLINFFVPIGLFGGLMAIIMATSGVNFLKPFAYQCFIYHAGMVWFALYLIVTKQVNLNLKVFVTNVIVLASLAIIMIWVNSALSIYETNFFYVVSPPASGLPFLNLKHGWYVYFAHLASAGVLLEFLTSLPYIIKEIKEKRA